MHALSRHLPHFGPLPALTARPAAPAEKPATAPSRSALVAERPRQDARFSQDELSRAVDFARTEGRREAEEAAQAALAAAEAARFEDQQAFEARIAAMREEWTLQEADRLASGFKDALEGLGAQLSDALAPILAPFVEEKVRAHALRDLASLVQQQMALGSGTIRISGPQDLIDALGARLGAASGITFTPAATAEVRMEADGAVIETQLEAWRHRLAGLSD